MSKTQIPTGGIADDAISEEHLDATAITGHTALAEAPASTDEFLISDGGVLKKLDASYVGGSAGTESFYVSKSSSDDQTLSNNTTTKISFDTEGVDVGNNFASNKYTVPSAGKYFFEAQVKGETNIDSGISNMTAYIYKNGSIVAATSNILTAGYEKLISLNLSTLLDLAQNDYLEVYMNLNYSTSATISVKGGSNATTHFLGFKLA